MVAFRSSSAKAPQTHWRRLTSMGVELAAAMIGFTLVGLWIDRRYATEPWGVAIGAILGLVGGMYNFLRQALRATQSSPVPRPASEDSEQPR